jgi:hypothetical protein
MVSPDEAAARGALIRHLRDLKEHVIRPKTAMTVLEELGWHVSLTRRFGYPPAGSTSCQMVSPVSMSMARMRSSVAAAMKISPAAVITAPPLLGVPIVIGRYEGMPNGPLQRAVPRGRSHSVYPVCRSVALIPP